MTEEINNKTELNENKTEDLLDLNNDKEKIESERKEEDTNNILTEIEMCNDNLAEIKHLPICETHIKELPLVGVEKSEEVSSIPRFTIEYPEPIIVSSEKIILKKWKGPIIKEIKPANDVLQLTANNTLQLKDIREKRIKPRNIASRDLVKQKKEIQIESKPTNIKKNEFLKTKMKYLYFNIIRTPLVILITVLSFLFVVLYVFFKLLFIITKAPINIIEGFFINLADIFSKKTKQNKKQESIKSAPTEHSIELTFKRKTIKKIAYETKNFFIKEKNNIKKFSDLSFSEWLIKLKEIKEVEETLKETDIYTMEFKKELIQVYLNVKETSYREIIKYNKNKFSFT